MKRTYTILWADDDIDDREMFREVLQAHASDHQIIEFPNGMELLSFLYTQDKQHFPCLIVLDLNMPVLGGRETLVSLKDDADFRDIPVAVFSTSNSPKDKSFCDKFNVAMLTKPPSYAQLKSAVEHLIDLCAHSQIKAA